MFKGILKPLVETARDKKEDLITITKDLTKTTLGPDVLKDIPIVEWAMVFCTINDAYSHRKLLYNTKAFLEGTETIGDSDKLEKYLNKSLENKPQETIDAISEVLIESYTDHKAYIIGRLVKACGEDQLESGELLHLLHITTNASIPALESLREVMSSTTQNASGEYTVNTSDINESLVSSCGLGLSIRHGVFKVNDLGVKLYQFGFSKVIDPLLIEQGKTEIHITKNICLDKSHINKIIIVDPSSDSDIQIALPKCSDCSKYNRVFIQNKSSKIAKIIPDKSSDDIFDSSYTDMYLSGGQNQNFETDGVSNWSKV